MVMHTNYPSQEAHTRVDSSTTLSQVARGSSPITRTSDLTAHLSDVPIELRSYLTTTDRPHEIHSVLQASRDRRLRLLLRRFTNQLQYGCKNPHCDIPTCLSYRKRHSRVPVRPYNDVTARALAWRCVEDYASGSKNIILNEYQNTDRKTTGGSRIGVRASNDGLCWNEPVIPWFEDPRKYTRRSKIGSDQLVQHNGDASADASSSKVGKVSKRPTSARSESRFASAKPNTITKSNEHGVNDYKEYLQRRNAFEGQRREPERQDKSDAEQVEHVTNGNSTLQENKPSVRFENVEPPQEMPPQKLKDTASFVQSIYDTHSIKTYDSTQDQCSEGCNLPRMQITPQIGRESTPIETPSADHEQSDRKNKTPEKVHTFDLLPTSILIWLPHALSRQRRSEQLIRQTKIGAADGTRDLEVFAKQSVFFCLSNPSRLLTSASMWFHIPSSNNTDAQGLDQDLTKLIDRMMKEAVATEANQTEVRAGQRLPRLKDALWAFDLLSNIVPYHEVLNSIFAALQHTYLLPMSVKTAHNTPRTFSSPTSQEPIRKLRSPTSRNAHSTEQETVGFLDDDTTARVCVVVLLAVTNVWVKLGRSPFARRDLRAMASTEEMYLICRNSGSVFPHSYISTALPKEPNSEWHANYDAVLTRIDTYDNVYLLRLLESFADVVSHRLAITETMKTARASSIHLHKSKTVVDRVVQHMLALDEDGKLEGPKTKISAWTLLELMCIVLLKAWDRKPIVQRTGPVGGALHMLAGLYRSRADFGIPAIHFAFKFVADSFDDIRMPVDWLAFRENSRQMHILSFSFLFEPSTLVRYFRAVNIEIMRRSYEGASIVYLNALHFLNTSQNIPVYGSKEVLAAIRPHMAHFFVLSIGRTHLLEDAMNQIWRRQKQEMMRPLKVILGKNQGEDGLDHGGVQQEFFRLVFAEAIDPDYGMFTVDRRTQMTWFHPGSLEPLYKFEALGILMSLAAYNGITLPVTFPMAFYRKLLGHKVKHLEHIEDGWPELAKGLRTLREWEDGDVGDVIARTYEFSYEAFGQSTNIDMTKIDRDAPWPPVERRKLKDRTKTATFEMFHDISRVSTPPSDLASGYSSQSLDRLLRSPSQESSRPPTPLSVLSFNSNPLSIPDSPVSPATSIEAPLVTNANRDKYIKDYIFWLANKSISPQYEAFAKGFHTCLDQTALTIFTPEALRSVIEGHTEIDIDELQDTATYDDYRPSDQIIQDFWDVVRDFTSIQHQKLLEFVTASARVPVNGLRSITFRIQRNGVSDERLPSSSTCYGRLLLPRYSSKEILRQKLEKAIENSVGFGTL